MKMLKPIILLVFSLLSSGLCLTTKSETFGERYGLFPRLLFHNATNHNVEITYTYQPKKISQAIVSQTISLTPAKPISAINILIDPSTITSLKVIIKDENNKKIAENIFSSSMLLWKEAYVAYDTLPPAERSKITSLDITILFSQQAGKISLNGSLGIELMHLVSQ